jgi:hypothetical protein
LPQQRFEAKTLEEALAKASASLGPSATVVEANRLRRGGVGGFFAKERFEVTVDEPGVAPGASTEPESFGGTHHQDVLRGHSPSSIATLLLDREDEQGGRDGDGDPIDRLSTEQASFAELVARLTEEVGRDELPMAFGGPSPAAALAHRFPPVELEPASPLATYEPPAVAAPPAAVPAFRPTTATTATTATTTTSVTTAPLPVHDPHRLLDLLSALPVAPPLPRGPGEVLAVLGERDDALTAARALATELGLDPRSVLLASEDDAGEDLWPGGLLPSVAAIAETRCSARFRPEVTVVAVAAPLGRTAGPFARRALDALEPTAVWAAVDAGRKPQDVAAWAARLGGVAAFAVTGLDDTTTPADALGLGAPVARLDGRPASPARWMALLLERESAR